MLFHYTERKLFDNIMLNNDFLRMQKIILTHTRVPQEWLSNSVDFLRTFFRMKYYFHVYECLVNVYVCMRVFLF